MGADHQKIGRKILDLHGEKVGTWHVTLEKTATKPEVVTLVKDEARAEFMIDLFIACSMRETLIIGQGIVPSSYSPKRRWPKKHNQP
jgi:hypothetical protein